MLWRVVATGGGAAECGLNDAGREERKPSPVFIMFVLCPLHVDCPSAAALMQAAPSLAEADAGWWLVYVMLLSNVVSV